MTSYIAEPAMLTTMREHERNLLDDDRTKSLFSFLADLEDRTLDPIWAETPDYVVSARRTVEAIASRATRQLVSDSAPTPAEIAAGTPKGYKTSSAVSSSDGSASIIPSVLSLKPGQRHNVWQLAISQPLKPLMNPKDVEVLNYLEHVETHTVDAKTFELVFTFMMNNPFITDSSRVVRATFELGLSACQTDSRCKLVSATAIEWKPKKDPRVAEHKVPGSRKRGREEETLRMGQPSFFRFFLKPDERIDGVDDDDTDDEVGALAVDHDAVANLFRSHLCVNPLPFASKEFILPGVRDQGEFDDDLDGDDDEEVDDDDDNEEDDFEEGDDDDEEEEFEEGDEEEEGDDEDSSSASSEEAADKPKGGKRAAPKEDCKQQ